MIGLSRNPSRSSLLARATNASGASTGSIAGGTYQDIPGLSITFTAGVRPVRIKTGGFSTSQSSVAGGRPELRITDNANVAVARAIGQNSATGIQPSPLACEVMLTNLVPGQSYTYKARVGNNTGAPNTSVTLTGSADSIGFIEAVEV